MDPEDEGVVKWERFLEVAALKIRCQLLPRSRLGMKRCDILISRPLIREYRSRSRYAGRSREGFQIVYSWRRGTYTPTGSEEGSE